MHELGHTLGLRHYSPPSSTAYMRDYQPNYFSVMSYLYQLHGIKKKGSEQEPYLDYSRGEVAAINEASVNESLGFQSVPASARFAEHLVPHAYICSPSSSGGNTCVRRELLHGACLLSTPSTTPCGIDFDLNGTISNTPSQINIDDNPQAQTIPKSVNDWERLNFGGIGFMQTGTSNRHNTKHELSTEVHRVIQSFSVMSPSSNLSELTAEQTQEADNNDQYQSRIQTLNAQSLSMEYVTCDNPL